MRKNNAAIAISNNKLDNEAKLIKLESIIETISVSSVSLLALGIDEHKVTDIISLILQELIDDNNNYDNNDNNLTSREIRKEVKNLATEVIRSSNQVLSFTDSTTESITAASMCMRQHCNNGLFDCDAMNNVSSSGSGQEILLSSSCSTVIIPDLCESSESTTTKTNDITKPKQKNGNVKSNYQNNAVISNGSNTINNTHHLVIKNIIITIGILLLSNNNNTINLNEEMMESITCLLIQKQSKLIISKKEECIKIINAIIEKADNNTKRRGNHRHSNNNDNCFDGQVIISTSKIIVSSITLGVPCDNIIQLVNTLLSSTKKDSKNIIRSMSNLNQLNSNKKKWYNKGTSNNKDNDCDVSTVLSYVSTIAPNIDGDDGSSISSRSSTCGSTWSSSSSNSSSSSAMSSSSYASHSTATFTLLTNVEEEEETIFTKTIEKDYCNSILGNINDNNEDEDIWIYEEIEQENIKPLEMIVTNNNNIEDIDDGIQLLSVCDSSYEDNITAFMHSEDENGNKNNNDDKVKKMNDKNDNNNSSKANDNSKDNYYEIMPVSWKLVSYMIDLCIKLDCNNRTITTATSSTKDQNLQCTVPDDITPIVGNISAIKKKERSTNTKTTTTTTTTASNTINSNNNKRESLPTKKKSKGHKSYKESIETLHTAYKNETILLLKLLPSSFHSNKDTYNNDMVTKIDKPKEDLDIDDSNNNIEVIIDGINQVFVLATTPDILLISPNNKNNVDIRRSIKRIKSNLFKTKTYKNAIKNRILKSSSPTSFLSFNSNDNNKDSFDVLNSCTNGMSSYCYKNNHKLNEQDQQEMSTPAQSKSLNNTKNNKPISIKKSNNNSRNFLNNITNTTQTTNNNNIARVRNFKKTKNKKSNIKKTPKLVIVESSLGQVDIETIQGSGSSTSINSNNNSLGYPFIHKINSDNDNDVTVHVNTTKNRKWK